MLDNFLKKIPDSFINALGVISAIITIIGALVTIIKSVRQLLNGQLSFTALVNEHLALGFTVLFSIWLLYKIIKYRKIQAETREIFSRGYYDILRGYRNVMGEIEVSDYSKEAVYQLVYNYSTDVLNTLCDIFYKLTRQKVSGCIKIIEPSSDLEYTNAKVKTFCRSKNSDSRRTVYDNNSTRSDTIVCRNTDFDSIVQPGKSLSCFYQQNLEDYQKQLRKIGEEYRNSNTEWNEYYKATIVAPIRIANKRNSKTKLEDSYTILGFLCVDSLSTHAFEASQRVYYQYIIKAFAALLYSVLDVYKDRMGMRDSNTSQSESDCCKKTDISKQQ